MMSTSLFDDEPVDPQAETERISRKPFLSVCDIENDICARKMDGLWSDKSPVLVVNHKPGYTLLDD